MKPTSTKLALLMSLMGLGLAGSGPAMAVDQAVRGASPASGADIPHALEPPEGGLGVKPAHSGGATAGQPVAKDDDARPAQAQPQDARCAPGPQGTHAAVIDESPARAAPAGDRSLHMDQQAGGAPVEPEATTTAIATAVVPHGEPEVSSLLQQETLAGREALETLVPGPQVSASAVAPALASAIRSTARASIASRPGPAIQAATPMASATTPGERAAPVGPACNDEPRAEARGLAVARPPMGDGWLALSEGKLDDVRGGFVTDTGLKISFGIQQAVYINGQLITTTSLNVSGLGQAGAQSTASGPRAANPGNVTLVQNGPGNVFSPSPLSNGAYGTVIQNTLSNQQIRTITTINATVNSLQLLAGMNLASSLRAAMGGSLGH